MEKLERETWACVVDFPDYDVSNFGRVRSRLHREPRVLRPICVGRNRRYRAVRLKPRNLHGSVLCYIHRLVAIAFVTGDGDEVMFRDRDRTNAAATNLMWASASARRKAAIRTRRT